MVFFSSISEEKVSFLRRFIFRKGLFAASQTMIFNVFAFGSFVGCSSGSLRPQQPGFLLLECPSRLGLLLRIGFFIPSAFDVATLSSSFRIFKSLSSIFRKFNILACSRGGIIHLPRLTLTKINSLGISFETFVSFSSLVVET